MRIANPNEKQAQEPEKVYFCPSCMYNKNRPGSCPNCGSILTTNNPESKLMGTSGMHRRQE